MFPCEPGASGWREARGINVPAQRQSSRRNSLFAGGRWTFLFYSGPADWIRTDSQGGQSALVSLSTEMLNSFKNTLAETLKIMCDQTFGHPVTQSSWHTKLIITPSAGRIHYPLWARVTLMDGIFKERYRHPIKLFKVISSTLSVSYSYSSTIRFF